MAKDQVYQDSLEVQRAKEREDEDHNMRVEQIQTHLRTLDYKITEISQLIMMHKQEKGEYMQAIERMKMQLITYQQQEK